MEGVEFPYQRGKEDICMKINQVEELVGITKKNIRFYEEEGLITPKRNSDNGYRDYSLEDINVLKQIKFLRKLSVPIEEIRSIQQRRLTLIDCLERHLIFLQRESQNIDCTINICNSIIEKQEQLDTIEVANYLDEMDQLEKDGVRFKSVNNTDKKKKRMTASIIAAVCILALLSLYIGIYIFICISTKEQPPILISCLLLGIPAFIGCGVILALVQRIREIEGGEIDEASKY